MNFVSLLKFSWYYLCGFIFGSVFWSINIFAILSPIGCPHGYSAFISWPRQHTKKQRHHFADKGLYIKTMVFPVVMYRVSSTIKKAEHWSTYDLKLRFWRRLLRVPWAVRKSNLSILKEINPEYSLEGLILKLKLQDFGHLMQRADSLKKTLILGKTESRRRRQQRIRCLNSIIR